MTHTPGPWSIRETDDPDGADIRGPNGIELALCCMSDAHLIAAAPDLLAALKRAQPWLGKLIADGGHRQSVLPRDAEIALDMVSDAIAKAEREAP